MPEFEPLCTDRRTQKLAGVRSTNMRARKKAVATMTPSTEGRDGTRPGKGAGGNVLRVEGAAGRDLTE